MNKSSTNSYHHGNLKDSLIKESLLMVEENGVTSITLRGLAQKIGASRSAIYRHFDSKDDLIKSVIKAGFDKLDVEISKEISQDEDILTNLQVMGKSYIKFAINYPNIYRMIFGNEVGKQREESCDINNEEDAIGFHKLISLIVIAQNENILKKNDPTMQATVIWSMFHGLSNLLIDGHIHIKENLEILFELSFDTLLNGMKN